MIIAVMALLLVVGFLWVVVGKQKSRHRVLALIKKTSVYELTGLDKELFEDILSSYHVALPLKKK